MIAIEQNKLEKRIAGKIGEKKAKWALNAILNFYLATLTKQKLPLGHLPKSDSMHLH